MKQRLSIALFIVAVLLLVSCNNSIKNEIVKGIKKGDFGATNGKQVFLYTLTNSKGDIVTITNYGGIVTSWVSKDKNGKESSIVIGFNNLKDYLAKPPYFGALIGRYGNRIAEGKFKIDNVAYTLPQNDGKNHLHGGNKGFDKVVWDGAIINDTIPTLKLNYFSKDGEEGYPGNLHVEVIYTLSDENELQIEYSATTDKATPINLTNHAYFNLTGDVANTILNHSLIIVADNYTPVDSTLIPTGVIALVKGTPFDFTKPEKIGARIDRVKGGYDHNFVLNKKYDSLQLAAVLSEPVSGRKLEVYTVEPGIQFYTGNFLDGKFINYDGKPIKQHAALCLETQHFPNSPNQPNFPSTILRPDETYHTITKYKLSVQ
jgi:aldose 1-epimerase